MEVERRRIGVLGGTFNPVHKGHLHLARELQRIHCLDEVWFVPAYKSPHKLDRVALSAEERLALVALSIGEEPTFKLVDWEAKRKTPSYTVETLRYLKSCHPNDHFFLLLGQDSVARFDQWKDPLEILELADLIVASREETPFTPHFEEDVVNKKLNEGFTPIPLFEASSSEVRALLSRGMSADHLLPKAVSDYITLHNLYRSPT